MILVTVGLHEQPFERLVLAADGMAACTSEPVIIQRGVACHVPEYAAWFDAVPACQMACLVGQARVLVSHAGAGSILAAFQAHLPLILVPRLRCWGEAIDDHQLQLAVALAQQGRAALLRDVSPDTLLRATQRVEWASSSLPAASLQQALYSWLACVPARPARRWSVLGRGGHIAE
jgi:beta-1,4-N-acetylglucosaminyltransferase